MPLALPRSFWSDPAGRCRLFHGDAATVLARTPSQSVQCVVTSPPYFALRKYKGCDPGLEIGVEKTATEYVQRLVTVFREVRRVLRDDGTCFLNLGDTWQGERDGSTAAVPWRVALALREDGWVL